jgi:hypothetical protein
LPPWSVLPPASWSLATTPPVVQAMCGPEFLTLKGVVRDQGGYLLLLNDKLKCEGQMDARTSYYMTSLASKADFETAYIVYFE